MHDYRRIGLVRCKLYPFKLLDWKISGASIVAGKDWILSGKDFRKSKAQRQTVGSSESMNFRKVENRRDFLATEKRRRRRWLLGILNSRSRESFLSWHGATDAGSFPLIKYSIEVYKTPSRRMNLIMSSWTNICHREKYLAANRVAGS